MSGRPRTKPSRTKSLANEVLAVVLVEASASVLLLLSLLTYDLSIQAGIRQSQQEPGNVIGLVGRSRQAIFLNLFDLPRF